MAFQRPAIHILIDPVLYEDQINLNFRKIDESFVAIQNDFGQLFNQQTSSFSNLAFVDKLLAPAGPVGHDSFELDWVIDTDQNWTVQFNRSTPDGVQQAVISSLLHEFQSETRPTLNVTAAVPAGIGPHRMILGLVSEGFPRMRAIIASQPQPVTTDTEDSDFADLLLYEFQYELVTDGPIIHSVRRLTQPIISNTAYQRLENKVDTLTIFHQGLLPQLEDDHGPFFIIPYDCEVVEGAAILRTGPAPLDIVEVNLERFGFTSGTANDRSEAVLARAFIWGNLTDADAVVQPDGVNSPDAVIVIPGPAAGLVQLKKDDYVSLRYDSVEAVQTDEQAADLTIQLRIRRISHDPRRLPS